ncbi:MAG: hypothetical protein HOG49_19020 [Candidatus Scalindua sp.]|jgi:hypothetical protein|nr:hypothetical protein [Candidatus Scalindua sp.]
MDILKKLRHLAIQNAFNEKQTADFINLVESGTSIDDAIDMVEEGISKDKPVENDVTIDKRNKMFREMSCSLEKLEALKDDTRFRHLAFSNRFNKKETDRFVGLVKSGKGISKAIDIVEEEISENELVEEIKEDVTTDRFNEEMLQEMIALTHLLKDLVNEMNYDEEDLLTNCGIVSCWIVITALQDKEDNDSFFQYVIQSHREPDEKPDQDGERVLIKIFTSEFEKLDASFEQWRKDPTLTITHIFAKTILDAIIKGDSGEGKEAYLNLEYEIIIIFFVDQFKDLVKKNISLTEKIYGEKNKTVQKKVTTEKPTEQPKEVCSALDILDEAEYKLDSPAFEKVQEWVKLSIQENISDVVRIIRKEQPPRHYVYSMIANASGDWLESGDYHMYRGVLNPMGEGMLKLFDTTVDELVLIGACDKEFAKEQKKGVRANIKKVG